MHQLGEHLKVLDQLPHGGVEHGEVGLCEPVQRLVAGGALVAEHRHRALDDRVGGGLDVEGDVLAALRRIADAQPAATRMQPFDRLAVRGVHEPFGGEAGTTGVEPEVDDGLHRAPRPRVGHLPGEPEPRRSPRWPPRVADGRGTVLGSKPGGRCDRLARCMPCLDGELDGLRVHRRTDPVAQDAFQPVFDQFAVVVHRRTVLSGVRVVATGRRFPVFHCSAFTRF